MNEIENEMEMEIEIEMESESKQMIVEVASECDRSDWHRKEREAVKP